MNKFFRCTAVFFCALLLTAGITRAQVQLRLKFAPGETIKQIMTQTMTSTGSVMGQPMKSTSDQAMHMQIAVDEVAEDGTASVRQQFTRITAHMQMPAPANKVYDYDSAAEKNPNAPPGYNGMMGAMVATEFKMKIAPTGQMSDIVIPPEFIAKFKSMPGAAMMGDFASEEGLKKMMGQAAYALPQGPVNKGDQWESPITSMKLPFGTITIQPHYTYEGPNEDGLHQISVKFDMKLEPATNSPIHMTLSDAKSHGMILFDNEAGRTVSSEMTQDMTMETTIGNQKISQQVQQVIRVAQEK